MQQPEIEAVVEFVLAHSNIVGAVNYHTNLGAIVMPHKIRDRPLPVEDQEVFKRTAGLGKEQTGYFPISTREEFRPGDTPPRRGTATDFLYGQLGIVAFVTELWSVYAEAGIEETDYHSTRSLSEEDSLRLLQWNDEHLGGDGFVAWTLFDHPQLGQVEIGGWKRLFTFRNPPGQFVEEMARKNTLFTLKHALTSPQLRINDLSVIQVAETVFRVVAVVENHGYLPTNVTTRAIETDAVKPVIVRLELDEEAELVGGQAEVDLGHLPGRWKRSRSGYHRVWDWDPPKRRVEWVVGCREQGTSPVVRVVAVSSRAGVDRKTVQLTQ
jgi:hypothetical protein